jgi:hypothetical protein
MCYVNSEVANVRSSLLPTLPLVGWVCRKKILELEDKNSSMLLAYSFASAKKEKYLYFLLGG